MQISDKYLLEALETLRHGGEDSVRLFLEMGRRCFDNGGQEFLSNWIGVAAAALPEAERNAVLMGLMQSFYGDAGAIIEARYESHTLQ